MVRKLMAEWVEAALQREMTRRPGEYKACVRVRVDLSSTTPAGDGGACSAFVPPGTMSGAVRWFAGNEPFSPVIDTLRGLLTGTPIGHSGLIAVAWCVGMTLVGYLWSRALFKREPAQ